MHIYAHFDRQLEKVVITLKLHLYFNIIVLTTYY